MCKCLEPQVGNALKLEALMIPYYDTNVLDMSLRLMVIKGLSKSMILVAEVCGQTRHGRLTMNLSSSLPVKTSQFESLLLIVIALIKIKVEGYFTLSTCGNNDLDVFRV